MTTLSPSLRRVLAVALLFAVAGLLQVAVVEPLSGAWRDGGEALASNRDRLARLVALAEGEGALQAALALRPDDTGEAIEAASETLAAAQLQDRLKAAVEEAGGQLSSVRVLPASEDGQLRGPFRRVALRAQVECGLAELQRALYVLEGGRPYVVVDGLSARVLPHPGRPDNDPLLSVQLDLMAPARIGKP